MTIMRYAFAIITWTLYQGKLDPIDIEIHSLRKPGRIFIFRRHFTICGYFITQLDIRRIQAYPDMEKASKIAQNFFLQSIHAIGTVL